MKIQKDVCEIGDILCIPYGNKFIYGRVKRDASIEVFNKVFDSKADLNSIPMNKVLLTSSVFFEDVESGRWSIIGNIPFESEESSWPPPMYIQDILNPSKYSIYYKGEKNKASKDEVENLEEAIIRRPWELLKLIDDKLEKQKKAH
ncbi:MAG: hypothetical protein HWE27_00235 [Gammaproteobacteria bacterium]|nr:hypothetical protein [Gammaproteobacteria bacterium]